MQKTPSLVCLVGTGRCGSTLLLNLLARHPSLAWPSGWTNAFPKWPAVALSHRFWKLKDPKDFRGWRGFPKPAEPNGALHHFLGEWYNVEDPEDLPDHLIATCREHFSKVAHYHGGEAILLKVVGFPVRASLFRAMWRNGKFIQISRHLKPTVSSTLAVSFYSGWGTMEDWQWVGIPANMFEFHKESAGCEAVGVAMGLWLQRRRIEEQMSRVPDAEYRNLSYVDLISCHLTQMRVLCDWLGLEKDSEFLTSLARAPVEQGKDDKWKKKLSKKQITNLDKFEELFGF